MSAPQLPNDDVSRRRRVASTPLRSAIDGQTRRQRSERGQLEPGSQQIEIGIAGGRGSRGGAARRELGGERLRIATPAQTDGQQAGGIGEPLPHEQLEAMPKLHLVGAGREISHTAPLLAQRGQRLHGNVDGMGIRMEQQAAPDAPERPCGLLGRLWALLLRAGHAFLDLGLLEPGARVGHARRSSDRREGAEANGVTQKPLVFGGRLKSQRTVQQVRALGADAQGGALETRRGAGRPRPERVTTQQCREFVGGRERVRRLAERVGLEWGDGTLSGGQRREPLRNRYRVDGPVPIDEVCAARRRRGEERM